MDFTQVVRRRRMVRSYRDTPVAGEALQRILDTAQRGPSAGFAQGVELVVIQSASGRRRLAEAAGEAGYAARGLPPWLSGAPVHIVVAVDRGRYEARYGEPDKAASTPPKQWPTPYWFVDAGAALMLLLLATTNEGLGAGFLGSHAFEDLASLVGLPPHFETIGLVTIGHPAASDRVGSATRRRRSAGDVIHREQWNGLR